MDTKQAWAYVQGCVAAQTAVAKLTGKQKIDGMTDREWKLISDIHIELAELSLSAVKRWEASK